MTAQISAYGRLVADPETRTTGKGTSMAMARLAVSLPCNAVESGEATLWLGVIAFGKQAEALAKHRKGDLVSVAGNMQLNQWMRQDGGTRQGYQVLADSVISARTTMSGGKRSVTESKHPSKLGATSPAPGWDVYNTPGDFDQRPPHEEDS
ncbi:single-stranded DNA-binding protein [Klebsiella oxytoca]